MTYLEYLGLSVSMAGTLASILGIFFAVYAKQNGKATRDFIAVENGTTKQFIAVQTKEMQKFTAEILLKLDERAEARHREIIETLKR